MAAQDKEDLTGAPSSSKRHPKKKLLLHSLLASFLLVAATIAIVTGVNFHKKPKKSNTNLTLSPSSHAVLKSSCSSTRFPDLCYSAIASSAPGTQLATQKDVIELSLNLTIRAVEDNFFTAEKLMKTKTLTKRETTALHDCLETIDDTLDELKKTCEDLKAYPNNKTITQHANDLKTLVSAAMTNPDTCIDGFSHEEADLHVRAALLAGQEHVERMCSNALAMVKNMTDGDIAREEVHSRSSNVKNRRLKEWPEWLSTADRRLLQATIISADTMVAADGSGDHKTVAAAVATAPTKSSKRYVIRIKAGTYNENVDVTKNKTNIMLMGDGRNTTIIRASRNVVDGSTTFKSATVAVVGQGFLARDITFQNTAGPSKHQAVALRVGSDLSAFYQCDILAYQDTLYVHSNRQIFINCLIVGTVDFIFGNSAAVFQDCDIHARRPDSGQKNMVTAQGRTDPNQNTGIVIQKCRIGATTDLESVNSSFPTYLGRPWKEYSRTVVMQSTISDMINPAGWHEWNESFALSTLFYGEYENSGGGADTSKRVDWKGFKVITNSTEAESFSPSKFIAGTSWLASTSFPYSLGL